mgnify:FL=1
MRIISGKARGTKLYTLEGLQTRPTLDRVKESLFNIIQARIVDSIFLDLFAGSGAIGLEAVSRGATKAILCDNSEKAIEIIKTNTKKTHTEDKVKIYKMQYDRLLKSLKEKVDIIYIDPPYDSKLASNAVKLILEGDILKPDTIMIIETDQKGRILEELSEVNVEVIDERKYGRAQLIFLRKG